MSIDVTVGTTLPDLVPPPISRTTLALFAGGSGDHNPVHIDLDAARDAGMDDVFAHGMLSMAYLARMLTRWVSQDRIRTMHVRFTTITPVHAQPRCTGRVVAIDDYGGEQRATVELRVTLPDGTTTLLGDATVAIS